MVNQKKLEDSVKKGSAICSTFDDHLGFRIKVCICIYRDFFSRTTFGQVITKLYSKIIGSVFQSCKYLGTKSIVTVLRNLTIKVGSADEPNCEVDLEEPSLEQTQVQFKLKFK